MRIVDIAITRREFKNHPTYAEEGYKYGYRVIYEEEGKLKGQDEKYFGGDHIYSITNVWIWAKDLAKSLDNKNRVEPHTTWQGLTQ